MSYDDFIATLKALNLDKKEFANIVKMNPASVSNWKQYGIPNWVEPFLFYYRGYKEMELAIKTFNKYK